MNPLPPAADLERVELTLVRYRFGAARSGGDHTPVHVVYELHHDDVGCVARWSGQTTVDEESLSRLELLAGWVDEQ